VSRQTRAALAAFVGLLAGLGILAAVVLVLRDEGSGSPPTTASASDAVETGTTESTGTATTEGSPAETIDVGGFPNAVAVGSGGVWVVRDGRRLIRIDPKTRAVTRIGAGEELGSERPCDVAVGAGAVFATTVSGAVTRISVKTGRFTWLRPLEDAACVAVGAGSVWVTSPNKGEVARLDAKSGETLATIPLDGFPQGIAVGFRSVWVAASDPPDGTAGGVSRIDPRSNEVVRTILVPNLPEFLAIGAGAVWTTSNNGTVAEIDPGTNQLVSRIRVSDGGRTSVAAARGAVYAVELQHPDEPAPIYRIDPQTGQVSPDTLSAGRNPLGMAWGAGALWVANYDDGTVSRIVP
jgi:streptogramin lyase